MRYVIYGIGAIGGTIAGHLAMAGQEVVGIARGAQLAAITAGGLLVRTPRKSATVHFACYADPAEIGIRQDDVIILAVKAQDTLAALGSLREAGVYRQAVVCAQNGVANERMTLRRFPNVYAMLIVMPAAFWKPGEVLAFGGPRLGLLDLGRAVGGTDGICATIAADLTGAGFAASPDPTIMRRKYGKLVINVGNMIEASLGPEALGGRHHQAARLEAEAVLTAAGIEFLDPFEDPELPGITEWQSIVGVAKPQSSSWQSLSRDTGSLETDYLNGEFVMLGRSHGVPTPVNSGLCRLGHWMLRQGVAPGTVSESTVDRFIAEEHDYAWAASGS